MFRYLLYLFFFYFVFRFVFGKLIGGSMKSKVFPFGSDKGFRKEGEEEDEGTVTIKPGKTGKNKDNKNLGEYVDYEEVGD